MSKQHLVERFADAGLDLQLLEAPISNGPGAAEIFQMDIRRKRPRDPHSEYFVAWTGHADNLAVVQGLDEDERQLVLMVREPKREFYEPVPQWTFRSLLKRFENGWRNELARQAGVSRDDLIVQGNAAWVRRVTPDRKRHFLAGCDERQLFMCRLPQACTTVRQAHEVLRAPAAKDSRSAIDRPVRQGEWFFLAVPDAELAELERNIAGHRAWVRRKVSIGSVIPRAGKPHVADELVVTSPGRDGGQLNVYVRGAVRHVDHRTIHFDRWRRVLRNREVDEGRSVLGGRWID